MSEYGLSHILVCPEYVHLALSETQGMPM